MQKTRKISFLKSLFGAKRHQAQPKKAPQPIDQSQLSRVAGGVTEGENGLPRDGWG